MTIQAHNFTKSLGPGWVQLSPPNPDLPNLVCFHFAGGSAQSFQGWASAFNGVANLIVYELPGRGRRHGEPFVTSLKDAAKQIVDHWAVDFAADTLLCGHSLGALLAFETALQLQRRSQPLPSALILMARQAPGASTNKHSLPEPTLDGLRRYLGRLKGTPAAVLNDDSFMELMVPILRADFELLRTYSPPKDVRRLPFPVHVIGALQDEIIDVASLLPWIEMAEDDHSVSLIDGGHFSPMSQPAFIRDVCFKSSKSVSSDTHTASSFTRQSHQGVSK